MSEIGHPHGDRPGDVYAPERVKDDCVVTPHGTLVHKRWLNPDGSYKQGIELEKALLLRDMEEIARRILDLANRM